MAIDANNINCKLISIHADYAPSRTLMNNNIRRVATVDISSLKHSD